jgi:hypothetical protein
MFLKRKNNMNNSREKLKRIVTKTVLKILNEGQWSVPFNIPVQHKPEAGFKVPVNTIKKGTSRADKLPLIHPDIFKTAKEIPRPNPNQTNEDKIRDTQNIPTNSEFAEDPIDSRGKFDGLNMKRSVK